MELPIPNDASILLRLTIAGDPIPKGRPRVARGHAYTPKRTADAEAVIRTATMLEWGAQEAHEGPVGVVVTFYCATRRRTDGDNLMKLVTDALQRTSKARGVIADDSQIEEWSCRLHRRMEGQEPRTEVTLYRLQ